MDNKEKLKDYVKRLRLYYIASKLDDLLIRAQQDRPTYQEFLFDIMQAEINNKENRDFTRRLSAAHLPARHDLNLFDFNYNSGIDKMQMKQLRELTWLEQSYNVILMGPSGTGKTFIAAGLVYEAIKNGLKA